MIHYTAIPLKIQVVFLNLKKIMLCKSIENRAKMWYNTINSI